MKSHEEYSKRSRGYQLPIIILSVMCGSGNFVSTSFPENQDTIILGVGVLSIITSIISSIAQYLKLAEKLFSKNGEKYVGSWNFGPNNINLSVLKLAQLGKKIFNSKSKIIIKKNKKKNKHEAKYLSLNSKKSLKKLNWRVYLKPEKSLKLTFDWFKVFYSKKNKTEIINYTNKQLQNFQKLIKYY